MAGRSSSIDVFLRLKGQRQFKKDAHQAGADLESIGVKGARSIAAFAATSDKLKSFGRSWTRNVSLPVTVGLGLAGKAAVDWESSFAGVRKTVTGTEKQYASLEKGIRGMSMQIPVAANELAGIAEAAGQLGIKRKAILGFTRTIADLGVATNLAGDEGATTLAKFANNTQMAQSNFDRLGSTIVALGNDGASTEKDIAAMGLRIAKTGHFVGLSESQILGYANALSSIGIEAEAGGTSISTVFKTINTAVANGGKELNEFAQIAGVSSGKFAQSWKRDAGLTSVAWIEGLGRMAKEGKDISAVLNELSPKLRGSRVQDTLIGASGAGKDLRDSIALGAKAWRENNALTQEAEKRYETVASKLQILKNKVVDAGVTLGQDLLPPLIDLVNFVGPQIAALADGFASLPGPVKATALGLLVLTGPVASGLGYFAGGMGRILILTSKAGKALSIFNATLSSSVMTERSGARGAFGAASESLGAGGALRTAKGFAAGLTPAIAAFGIGNIVTSAASGDMKGAGFELGGAIVGGIAGALIPGAGPLGAMVGVGVGSMLGGLLGDLAGNSGPNRLQAQLKHAADATKSYRRALEHLSGSKGRAERAEKAHRNAVRDANHASKAQTRILGRAGANSLPAYRAALRLADANRQVAKTSRQARKANELHGFALKLYRRESLQTVAAEKQQIPTLRRHLAAVKKRMKTEGETTPLLRRTVNLTERLRGINDKLTKTYAEAEEKGGRPWAKRLQALTSMQAQYGMKGKVLSDRLDDQRNSLKQLTESGYEATPMWQDLRREIKQTTRALERFQETSATLSPPRVRPGSNKPKPATPQGQVPRRQGARSRGRTSGVPNRQPAQAGASSSLNLKGAYGRREITVKVPVHLDGKTIAESTARVAEDEAALA